MSAGSIAAASQHICRNAFVSGKAVTHNRYLAGAFSTAPHHRQVGDLDTSNQVIVDSESTAGNMSNPFIEIAGTTYYIRQWGISNVDIILVLAELDNSNTTTSLSATSIAGVTTSLGSYDVGDRSAFLNSTVSSGTVPPFARWTWSIGTNGISTNISGSHNGVTQGAGKAAHFHDFLRIDF